VLFMPAGTRAAVCARGSTPALSISPNAVGFS
jgi:hypothetical protein